MVAAISAAVILILGAFGAFRYGWRGGFDVLLDALILIGPSTFVVSVVPDYGWRDLFVFTAAIAIGVTAARRDVWIKRRAVAREEAREATRQEKRIAAIRRRLEDRPPFMVIDASELIEHAKQETVRREQWRAWLEDVTKPDRSRGDA